MNATASLLPVLLCWATFAQEPAPAAAPNAPGAPSSQAATSPATQAPATQTPAAQPATSPAPANQAPAATSGAATSAPSSTPGQGGATTPNSAYAIRTGVRLVVLDAVAIDKHGNAVTDLKKEEFHVSEQDEPQVVRNFYAPGFFTPRPDVVIRSTADLDRLARQAPVNIVVLDEFNTLFEDMSFARDSLKKFLKNQPAHMDTPTMLVAVDLQHFTVLQDYTQDKDALVSALDHHFAAYPWQAHQFAWIAERYATAFTTLSRVAEASVGHPGHKNMIWIGRGLPSVNPTGFSVDDRQRVNNAVQRTVNELRDARVTLYTIDPAGVVMDATRYGMAAQLFAPMGGVPDFEHLAHATGGRSLHGRNDVDAEIGSAIQDGSDVYSFSYRPTDSVADYRKFRRIQVTVDRPDVTVYTREGYYIELGPARVNKDGDLNARLATELVDASKSNMTYDAVHFTLHSTAEDPNTFVIHMDPSTLVWYYSRDNSKPRWTEILFMVTTFDKKGKELHTDIRRERATAPASAPATGRLAYALNLPYKLTPEAKAVRARMVVRIEANGRMGTAEIVIGRPTDTSSYGVDTPSAPSAATTTPPAPAKPEP